MLNKPLLIILGATASGKTKLAVQVAEELNGEIISADSRQVYRKMNIGTGKDLAEYHINGKIIPFHLIDILNPGEKYHVDAFKNDFYEAYRTITGKGNCPILCGGTGMYIHSLLQHQPYTSIPVDDVLRAKLNVLTKKELIACLEKYPSEISKHVDYNSKKRLIRAIEIAAFLRCNQIEEIKRPDIKPLVFGLKNKIENTRSNIFKRLDFRLKNGMIEEVEGLINDGVSKDMLTYYGLEYKFISGYISGEMSYDELRLKLGTAICQFAKRQNTFFRKMEKDGVFINWLDAESPLFLLKKQILERVWFHQINL